MDKPYTEEQIQAAMNFASVLRSIRKMLFALVCTLLLMGAALVVMALGLSAKSKKDVEASDAAKHGRDVAVCDGIFDNAVFKAGNALNEASYAVVIELGRQLLESGASHPPTAFDPTPILLKLSARDTAETDYTAQVKARDDWLKAGSPLPCPIKAGS